ncbi:hypothetical protein AAHA92_28978 [Salvia divinorum]|uniref:Uncharacterized protein n=1 Tax=Salvia divinorum TaxID=28513 RepID=A0ABD1FZD8_SALDI
MQEDDVAFWGPSSIEDFTVKTAYDSLVGVQDSVSSLPWVRIWNWYGPQRIKTFFWLLLKNGVLVNEERRRRHIATNAACGMCGLYMENRLHMLHDCLDARRTWEGLHKFCDLEWFFNPSLHLNDWIICNISSKLQAGSGVKCCTIFGVGCWNIWKKRCGFILNNERLSPESVLSQTIIMAKSVEDARMTTIVGERVPRQPVSVFWKPPLSTMLKLNMNTDASLERGTCHAYGGGLFRDASGQWRQGFVTNIRVCSILLAEIWCIFHGLETAKALRIRLLEVESDNLVAVAMIIGKFEVNISCHAIVEKIRSLLLEFDSTLVRHVHREGNSDTDLLSHHAYNFERGVHVLEQPPTDLAIWLLYDRLGISYNH